MNRERGSMKGFPREFARVTMLDGTVHQGGSNYGLVWELSGGILQIRPRALGKFLINGHHSARDITVPMNKVLKVEQDNYENGEVVAVATWVPQHNRFKPIQTSLGSKATV
jgi:hypothetical protein